MSASPRCPDWRLLLRHRLEAGHREPAGWAAALDHLTTCRDCRGRAVALDPTLIFARPPGEGIERAQLDDIKRSVHALRRAREVESSVERPAGAARKLGAAAVLLALLLLLPPTAVDPPETPAPRAIPGLEALGGVASGDPPPTLVSPMIEPLDRPLARIYQLGQEDLSLIMVVDESLDV